MEKWINGKTTGSPARLILTVAAQSEGLEKSRIILD
jgi:hypothetical protein